MSMLKTTLDNGQFAVTAEMAPPRGCDFTEQLEVAKLLKEWGVEEIFFVTSAIGENV